MMRVHRRYGHPFRKQIPKRMREEDAARRPPQHRMVTSPSADTAAEPPAETPVKKPLTLDRKHGKFDQQ